VNFLTSYREVSRAVLVVILEKVFFLISRLLLVLRQNSMGRFEGHKISYILSSPNFFIYCDGSATNGLSHFFVVGNTYEKIAYYQTCTARKNPLFGILDVCFRATVHLAARPRCRHVAAELCSTPPKRSSSRRVFLTWSPL
jgi:hypothetical protein